MKRVKRRYLAVKLIVDGDVMSRDILDAAWAAVNRLYGEFGASQAGLVLVNFNEEEKVAVIRVSLSMLQQTRAAIASVSQISGKDAALHVVAVSGTLKSLREA